MTGKYSIYFANQGYEVTSIELVEKHVVQIREKVNKKMSIEVFQGNALDLSMIKDNTYDIVLCFGPLYHLEKIEDRLKCISEVKRVCKEDGKIFFAFISNDMVITTETFLYNPNFLLGNSYNHESFKVADFPFVFHTVDNARKLLNDSNLNIISEIATDGLSELFADKINNMDEESYLQWLNYHLYCCEKPEFLGASNYLLFVTGKLNISKSEIIAFGDDINDKEMFVNSGIGVAMRNSIDEIKELADYICDTNDNDGVAK